MFKQRKIITEKGEHQLQIAINVFAFFTAYQEIVFIYSIE